MVTIDVFLSGLLIVSTFTGLVTEAIKKILIELNKPYHANTLAGIVAAVLSIGLGIGYVLISGLYFTPSIIVCIAGLVFMSWLCAMVGYDKVIGSFKKH